MSTTTTRCIRFAIFIVVAFATLLIPSMIGAQDSTAVTPEVVTSTVADGIFERLDAVVESTVEGVQVGAEFTWPILIRQQVIEGGLTLFAMLIGVVLLFISYNEWAKGFPYEKARKNAEYGTGEREAANSAMNLHYMTSSVTGVAGALITIFSGLTLFLANGATKLLNPEYHAIMDVLNALGVGG